jgi:ficolin
LTFIPQQLFTQFSAKSCFDHYKSGNKANDIYQIYPDGHGSFAVMCDMNGGGWTVFQHRHDGSVDFYLGWTEYKEGFGHLSGEFWLGLEKLHRITTSGRYKLRIDFEDFERNERFAEYSSFEVGNEQDGFRLSIGAFSGNYSY